MADIINTDPHAGNQDPQPYDGDDDIQVLTPVQEANKVNEKIIQYVRGGYNGEGGYAWWRDRHGRLWQGPIGYGCQNVCIIETRCGVMITWTKRGQTYWQEFHYPAE